MMAVVVENSVSKIIMTSENTHTAYCGSCDHSWARNASVAGNPTTASAHAVDLLKNCLGLFFKPQAGSSRPQHAQYFLLSDPRHSTGGSRPQSLHGIFPCPLSLIQVVINHRSLCSSYHMVLGQAQAVAATGLHQSSSQEIPEPTHPVAGF